MKTRRQIEEELMTAPIPGCDNTVGEDMGKHLVHTFNWIGDKLVDARLALEAHEEYCKTGSEADYNLFALLKEKALKLGE